MIRHSYSSMPMSPIFGQYNSECIFDSEIRCTSHDVQQA